jgi:hypothetical protein
MKALLISLVALAHAAPNQTRIDTVVCAMRCVEAGHCCEGDQSACGKPSCAMGCLIAVASAEASSCNKSCSKAAQSGCKPIVHNHSYNLCGMCPTSPTNCGCPQHDECELGCNLAFGAPVPVPTPPPTPVLKPLLPCKSNYNCSFNGKCLAGVCECEKAWTGMYCQQLNLLPVVNGSGLNQLHSAAKTSTW